MTALANGAMRVSSHTLITFGCDSSAARSIRATVPRTITTSSSFAASAAA